MGYSCFCAILFEKGFADSELVWNLISKPETERLLMGRKFLLLTVILAILAMASGCALLPAGRARVASSNQPEPTPIPTPIVPITPTYRVQRGTVVKQVQFTGRVAPSTEQELFFKTNGRVRRVLVKRGDMVTKGQLLADLEIENLERQLEMAQLELERARARLAEAETALQANIRRAEIQLEMAKLNLQMQQAQDPTPRKAQAEAELEQAKIALQQAQAAYDQIAWRNDRGVTPQAAALQQATLNFQKAQAAYDLAMQDIATHKYLVAIQERQVELAQIALDELKRGVDPLLKNDVSRAELSVESLQAAIADAQIIAPFDGKILSITLIEGREVAAYTPVATIADPHGLEVSADLQSTVMQELAEGMEVTMVLTARPGEQFKGTIKRLPYPYGTGGSSTDLAEQDKSTRVSIETLPEGAQLELGDLVRVTVVLETRENTLWLPPQAIRLFEGRRFVVVQDGDLQRRVDVKIGIEGEDRVEILEGLSEGQVVVGR